MSAPMSFCDSMDFSGVSSIRLPAFFGSSNSTPASVITASFSRETIWKPPLSVKMLPFHFIKLCSPPHLRNSSQVGRLAKWKVFPSKMRHPSVFMSSEDMPLMVPWVPTGMKTGVRTSPWGNVTVDARARPQVASKWKTKGLKYQNLPAVPTLKITTSPMALPIDLLALQKHVPNLTPCWQFSRVKFQPRGPPSKNEALLLREGQLYKRDKWEKFEGDSKTPTYIYIYIDIYRVISVRFDSFKFIPEEPAKDQIPWDPWVLLPASDQQIWQGSVFVDLLCRLQPQVWNRLKLLAHQHQVSSLTLLPYRRRTVVARLTAPRHRTSSIKNKTGFWISLNTTCADTNTCQEMPDTNRTREYNRVRQ